MQESNRFRRPFVWRHDTGDVIEDVGGIIDTEPDVDNVAFVGVLGAGGGRVMATTMRLSGGNCRSSTRSASIRLRFHRRRGMRGGGRSPSRTPLQTGFPAYREKNSDFPEKCTLTPWKLENAS